VIHGFGKDAVPVVDQKSITMIEGEEFAKLLDGPFGRGVFGYVAGAGCAANRFPTPQRQYSTRNVAVTETRKSQATIVFA
jgi:hypothetical protein